MPGGTAAIEANSPLNDRACVRIKATARSPASTSTPAWA
jgi:hypothetical protein